MYALVPPHSHFPPLPAGAPISAHIVPLIRPQIEALEADLAREKLARKAAVKQKDSFAKKLQAVLELSVGTAQETIAAQEALGGGEARRVWGMRVAARDLRGFAVCGRGDFAC